MSPLLSRSRPFELVIYCVNAGYNVSRTILTFFGGSKKSSVEAQSFRILFPLIDKKNVLKKVNKNEVKPLKKRKEKRNCKS